MLCLNLGDVKNRRRRSALKKSNKTHKNSPLENLIYDVLQDQGAIDQSGERGVEGGFVDNLSELSYGSHMNRDFDSGSHKGSFSKPCNDLLNEQQQGRLSMMLMDSGANLLRDGNRNFGLHADDHGFGIDISVGMYTDDEYSTSSPKAKRSVVIDDQDIDMFTPEEMDEKDVQARLEAEILEATTQELLMKEYPSDCCPETCYLRFPILAGGDPDSPFWQGWGNLRIKTFRLIENKYFETAVIAMILISSLALVSLMIQI